MYRKFIITQEGILRFGIVYQHNELLDYHEHGDGGGGLWKYDPLRDAILLYGRSFEFGPPDFSRLQRIDRTGLDVNKTATLLYLPQWPDESVVVPVDICN